MMNKIALVAALVVIVVLPPAFERHQDSSLHSAGHSPQQHSASSDSRLLSAYENRQSDLQVEGSGVVIKLLPDDLQGSRHQRFLLQLSHGQVLLVAHNIDLAPRIDTLNTGDRVDFYGEYEWNAKGGVIHWTHHDPAKSHADGWLRHAGRLYQ